jgi:hypothetical protein
MKSKYSLVAVCDILGYGNLIKQNPLQQVKNYHLKNIFNIVYSSIPRQRVKTQSTSDQELLITGAVGHVTFSDTVVIYSLRDSRDGRRNVLNAVYRLIAKPMNTPYYRFRVGIAYGELYVDKKRHIYVGKALVEAHDLEARQLWSGATLTQSAASVFMDLYPESSMLIDYDVPIRVGARRTRQRYTVINWTIARHTIAPAKTNWLWRSENGNRVMKYNDKEAEAKIRNVERFHQDVCVQCRNRRGLVTGQARKGTHNQAL